MTQRVARRIGTTAAALLIGVATTWALWPRPAVEIVIPPTGIAEVHQRFGAVTTIPDTIVVPAGGRPRVRITNRDTTAHRLGIFAAPAQQTVEFTLPRPGTYTGECSVHPTAKTLTFVVR
jgi:plastocyanin